MYSRNGILCLFILSVIISCACSVKEDRHVCPCIVTVDLNDLGSGRLHEMKASKVVYECVDTGCYYPGKVPSDVTFEVPRTGVSVVFHCLCSGWEANYGRNDFNIPFGCQCPGIYTYYKRLETNCEQLKDTVVMHKNFSRITVIASAFSGIADSLCFSGNVSGYHMDGTPLYGDFYCGEKLGQEGSVVLSVPRQIDGSLQLLVRAGNETFRSFSIGWAIISSGYDWSADDLTDITVELDYAATKVSYAPFPWTTTQIFTIVLKE